MKKYFVLGSSGLIGKNLCKYLNSNNCIVVEYDIKNSDNEDLRKNENDELTDLVMACNFVFFKAFDIGGAKFLSECDKNYTFLINNSRIIINTFNKLKLCGKQFVFLSSYLVQNSYHSYSLLKSLGENFTTALGGLL